MSSKCIAGQYPPYESAFPEKINTEITFDLKAAQECVKRALIFADETKSMKLKFRGPLLTVESHTYGQKEGEEVIEICSTFDTPFEVNYNGFLLSGILGILSGSRAHFYFESVSRPVKIVGEDQNKVSVFYLLVPSRN
jgi:DNA polymerase III sliding clamp (beta) subunit (PCNA family)